MKREAFVRMGSALALGLLLAGTNALLNADAADKQMDRDRTQLFDHDKDQIRDRDKILEPDMDRDHLQIRDRLDVPDQDRDRTHDRDQISK